MCEFDGAKRLKLEQIFVRMEQDEISLAAFDRYLDWEK
jgi:hypothetical protein